MIQILTFVGCVLLFLLGYMLSETSHKGEIKYLKEKHEREMEAIKRIWKTNKN